MFEREGEGEGEKVIGKQREESLERVAVYVGREPGRLVISPGGVISWMQLPSSAPTPFGNSCRRRDEEPGGARGREKGKREQEPEGGRNVRRCTLSSTPGEMAIECI